jgi:hypothetical protein
MNRIPGTNPTGLKQQQYGKSVSAESILGMDQFEPELPTYGRQGSSNSIQRNSGKKKDRFADTTFFELILERSSLM